MKKLNLSLFVLTLFVLTTFVNCTTQKRCAKKFPQVASYDSIYVETIKEIPVYIPGDTIKVEVPVINCPDQDLGIIETDKLKQEISILNGKLKSKTTIKPDSVIIYVPEIHERIVIEKKPVEVRYVPKFVKFLAWSGVILFLLIVAYLAFKMRFGGLLKIFK